MLISKYLEWAKTQPLTEDDLRSINYHLGSGSKLAINECMLAFNEETACCWGGPFPGNYAVAFVRNYKYRKDLRKVSDYDSFRIKEFETVKSPQKHGWKSWRDVPVPDPTVEFPVALHVTGNDDTSYAKYFDSVDAAVELLDLLEACADDKPLDMQMDFLSLDFVFTN